MSAGMDAKGDGGRIAADALRAVIDAWGVKREVAAATLGVSVFTLRNWLSPGNPRLVPSDVLALVLHGDVAVPERARLAGLQVLGGRHTGTEALRHGVGA